jgi:Polyketide cyclase / dehydrase and lipid transport
MGQVRVTQTFAGSVHEAERCWYDTSRWPEWIDGLSRVIEVGGGWPHQGAWVLWQSGPAGRGRVHETVIEFEPLRGQAVAVEDDSITGTQRVRFDPMADRVGVELSLEYVIKRRTPLTPLIDRLFVRGPMARSLAKTVERFGAALAGSRQPTVG